MNPRIFPLSSLSPAQLNAWRELAEQAAEPNPFMEPAFVLAAAQHLRSGRLFLFAPGRGNRFDAAVVLQPRHAFSKVPVPCFATRTNKYCFLGTPLIDAARVESGVAELIAMAKAGPYPLLALELLGNDGPVVEALEEVAAAQRTALVRWNIADRAALRRRHELTYLTNTHRTKRRRELNRLRRLAEREFSGISRTVDRSAEETAYDDFLRLEQSGWKGRVGTALADAPGDADFFRQACRAFAAEDRLQLLSWEVAGNRLSMKCNFRAGRGVFCFKIAYDENFAQYSPGIQLEVDNIELFHRERRAEWMDSCAEPDNTMINRLWPDRRSISTVLIAADHGVGRVLPRTMPRIARLRDRVQSARGARA